MRTLRRVLISPEDCCHRNPINVLGCQDIFIFKHSTQKGVVSLFDMLGFSLSPGGLLLPYHLGALAALEYHGYLTGETHLAGSSAGAIAVASHAAGVDPTVALDASIRVSSRCNPVYLAGGNLMKSLKQELETIFPDNAHEIINERPGVVGLAYLELFPTLHPTLETQDFGDRETVIEAVCNSSMFPYFTSNAPFRIVPGTGKVLPRVVVDGVFTEPLWRFGCPNLQSVVPSKDLDRSISVSVVPKELTGITVSSSSGENNVISPKLEENFAEQIVRLGLLACTPGSKTALIKLYEGAWSDVETWISNEIT